MMHAVSEALRQLDSRVTALEGRRAARRIASNRTVPLSLSHARAADADDAFARVMFARAVAYNLLHVRFVRCPSDYYDWPLSERRRFLGAPTVLHLTKTIVLENVTATATATTTTTDTTAAAADVKPATAHGAHPNSRFFACVVQYGHKIDLPRLEAALRASGQPAELKLRLVEDCQTVTGYQRNAVAPIGLDMPIVIDHAIMQLVPNYIWVGGGEVSLKLHLSLQEVVHALKPLILKFAVTE